MSAKPSLCPLCAKPVIAAYAPFCSRGCKDRDLLNWLGERYTIPVQDDETGLDSESEPRL